MRDSQIRFIRQQGFPGTHYPHSFYSALMFQPRFVVCVVALGVLLQSAWLFVALSAALWWSAWLPSLNPFDAIYNLAIAYPRGRRPLGTAPAPRRFAQGMAGAASMLIGIALIANAATLAWIIEGMFVVASMAVVFRDSCAGADAYYLLRRIRRPSTQKDGAPAASTRA